MDLIEMECKSAVYLGCWLCCSITFFAISTVSRFKGRNLCLAFRRARCLVQFIAFILWLYCYAARVWVCLFALAQRRGTCSPYGIGFMIVKGELLSASGCFRLLVCCRLAHNEKGSGTRSQCSEKAYAARPSTAGCSSHLIDFRILFCCKQHCYWFRSPIEMCIRMKSKTFPGNVCVCPCFCFCKGEVSLLCIIGCKRERAHTPLCL